MKKLFCLMICLLLSGTASAELYKWVDENGKVYYTDKDPSLDNKNPARKEIIEAEPANVFSADEANTKSSPKTETTPQPTPGSEGTPAPP